MTRKLKGKTKEEKAAYWKAHIEKFKEYEGSAHDYCLSEQISHSTFQNWRRELVTLKPSGFVPVVVATDAAKIQSVAHYNPSRAHLPDAVWVAEFILRLQQGAR
jgi:hypothetical protein